MEFCTKVNADNVNVGRIWLWSFWWYIKDKCNRQALLKVIDAQQNFG